MSLPVTATTEYVLENPLWEYVLSLWRTTCFRGWSERLQQHFALNGSLIAALGFVYSYHRLLAAEDMQALLRSVEPFHKKYQKKLTEVRQRAESYRSMGETIWTTWEELLLKAEMQAMQVEFAAIYHHVQYLPLQFMPAEQALSQNLQVYSEMAIEKTAMNQIKISELQQCLQEIAVEIRRNHSSDTRSEQ